MERIDLARAIIAATGFADFRDWAQDVIADERAAARRQTATWLAFSISRAD